MAMALSIGAIGCGSDKDDEGSSEPSSDSPNPTDTADPSDTGDPQDDDAIGDPIGDPVPIDHQTAQQTVVDNLTRHIDGLQNSLAFLEASETANNIYDMVFAADEVEGEEGEAAEEDEGLEFDFSGLRDSLVDLMRDDIMVEATSTVADDGMSISYRLSPEYFCDEQADEDESPEAEAERLEDEADCAERLAAHPVEMEVMSDGEGAMNISLLVGDDAVESLRLQLHDDMMSIITELPNLTALIEVFIHPDDFEMPRSMAGTLGAEMRLDGPLSYTARFAAPEDVRVKASDNQDQYALDMPENKRPGQITIDGTAETLSGSLSMDQLEAALPWQFVVDLFYDQEGHSEQICETDEEGVEDCWEEWVEAPETPEVDEALNIFMADVSGALEYTADDDVFRFTDMSLGDDTMLLSVDADTIIAFDLNPEDGRSMDLSIRSNEDAGVGFEFSPSLDVQVSLAWHKVSDTFEDLPSFLLDEIVGVEMAGADTPALDILRGEDTQFRVTAGQLRLWSSEMADDVLIDEGECITSIDEEALTEEEQDALHDLLGSLIGGTCET